MLLKQHVLLTCHETTNRFVGNFCPKKKWEEKRREWNMIFSISNEMEMHDP